MQADSNILFLTLKLKPVIPQHGNCGSCGSTGETVLCTTEGCGMRMCVMTEHDGAIHGMGCVKHSTVVDSFVCVHCYRRMKKPIPVRDGLCYIQRDY